MRLNGTQLASLGMVISQMETEDPTTIESDQRFQLTDAEHQELFKASQTFDDQKDPQFLSFLPYSLIEEGLGSFTPPKPKPDPKYQETSISRQQKAEPPEPRFDESTEFRIDIGDNLVYEGQLKDFAMQGKGRLFHKGKLMYQGDFVQSKFEGFGNMFNYPREEDAESHPYALVLGPWTEYLGTFKDNQKEGHGELRMLDGSVYVGEFKEDGACGLGTYQNLNGVNIYGRWEGNQLVERLG